MRVKLLNDLARELVGDGKRPNLYFVTDQGDTVLIASDLEIAREAWGKLAARYPLQECALEDRLYGVIASVEPVDDTEGAPLEVYASR